MRFVLTFAVVLSLLAFSPSHSFALEVSEQSDQYSRSLRQLADQLEPDLNQLPAVQQTRLSDVQIRMADHPRGLPMALALPGDSPAILISEQFLDGLSRYIEVYLLAREQQSPQWVEQYFSQYFWNQHPETPVVNLGTPWQFFTIEQRLRATLEPEKQRLFMTVLEDVLLHELGHHAMDAFYNFRASSYVRERAEREADQWAEQFREQTSGGGSALGRLLVIGYIFEQDRWSMLAGDGYFPRLLSAVIQHMPDHCPELSGLEPVAFCNRLRRDIDDYMSSQIESAYLQRIEAGESFAGFPMGQIQLAKSNFVDACHYFNESLIYGQVARAASYVGWCYQKGYLEPSPPDAQVLAMIHSRHGSGYGFSDRQGRALYLLSRN